MGKSYNNVIKLSELFTGLHPLLTQAYTPMTIRFFILQTHYRSTLDFSNEALHAAEKGLKRLWEAYENLQKLDVKSEMSNDKGLEEKVLKLMIEFDEFMNDDFNTAKVLANMFELVPIINGIKNKQLPEDSLSSNVIEQLKTKLKLYIEDILGLSANSKNNAQVDGIIRLLINIRKEAKAKKDFVTGDTIRNELLKLGVQLKDEKDGNMSYSFV
jgi:Cysteinyl-tRNA synthetase